jgi:hypothetical protein
MHFAEVFRVVGRDDQAVGAAEEALRLYEQKADLVSAQRAQHLLAQVTRAGPPLARHIGRRHREKENS